MDKAEGFKSKFDETLSGIFERKREREDLQIQNCYG